jgi:hypothetical protein
MTVKERILNAYATKNLDEALLELSLFREGKLIASGDGRLSVSASGRLQIEVNAEAIPFNFDFSSPGTIIPDEKFCEITAKTHDNLKFKANRLYAKTVFNSINKPARALFEPSEITFSSEAIQQACSSFDVFITSFDCDFFNRHSVGGEIKNPVFGDNLSGQWFSVETVEMAIGLRNDSDSLMHLKVNSKSAGASNVEKYATAFLNALKFHTGTNLKYLAYGHNTAEGENFILISHESNSKRQFYKPLPNHEFEAAEKLLVCGMNFFLQETCSPVLTALHVCWESRKVTFPANCLLVCSVVEGLADYILKDAETELKKLQSGLLASIDNHKNDENDSYLNRVKEAIKKEEFFKDAQKARKAADWLKIKITDTELAAWNKLRHPLAHGNFHINAESKIEIQDKLNQAACVANIVNKFVLALIRYEGPYRDYSTVEYPTCNFPS